MMECARPDEPTAPPAPQPAIPDDAWREVHSANSYSTKDLMFGFRPEPALRNIVDVRGDVSHCTDGVHCRFGIKLKLADGCELQLRGGGATRDATQAAAQAAYPLLAHWAAELGGSCDAS